MRIQLDMGRNKDYVPEEGYQIADPMSLYLFLNPIYHMNTQS